MTRDQFRGCGRRRRRRVLPFPPPPRFFSPFLLLPSADMSPIGRGKWGREQIAGEEDGKKKDDQENGPSSALSLSLSRSSHWCVLWGALIAAEGENGGQIHLWPIFQRPKMFGEKEKSFSRLLSPPFPLPPTLRAGESEWE